MLLKDFIKVVDKKTFLNIKPIGYVASAGYILEKPQITKYNLLELEIITIKPCDFNMIILNLKI